MQAVHSVDIAHSMFAVSLSGGAAVSLNLGQRKFHFDLGNLFASAAAQMSKTGSVASAISQGGSIASSVTSQAHGDRSLAGSLSVLNWRVSVGGRSARSQGSVDGLTSVFDGADDELEFGLHSHSGSTDTFASCKTSHTRAHAGTFSEPTDADDHEQRIPAVRNNTFGSDTNSRATTGQERTYLDRKFWRVLSINKDSELHNAVLGTRRGADTEEANHVGILKWLGWV